MNRPTRSHAHSIDLAAAPQRMFDLLITPGDIRGWWGATRAIVIPKPGGLWSAAWGEDENDPDYISAGVLKTFEPPQRIVLDPMWYHARDSVMPFDAELTIEFVIQPNDAGGCTLTVHQHGFPCDTIADDFYAACEKGWHDTFESIRRFVDSSEPGRPRPG